MGRKVLIVSTDPASNLDAVLNGAREPANADCRCAESPRHEYRSGGVRARLPRAHRRTVSRCFTAHEIALLEERLSGACTVEVAAFDEFALLLGDSERTDSFDHIVFDTAPTGHTLRLLELPAAWTGFLNRGMGDTSCLGPLSGLKAQRERYAQTVAALADPDRTVVVLVARPERVHWLKPFGRQASFALRA